MRNFHDTFEKPKRSFISAFSIFMTVPLSVKNNAKYLTNFFAVLKNVAVGTKMATMILSRR